VLDAWRRVSRGLPAFHTSLLLRPPIRALVRAATVEVLKRQAKHRKHPEETLRSAQGILRLARDFTPERIEAACERALQSYSYCAVRTLIETPAPPPSHPTRDLAYDNVRGSEYFQ
jgi:hypothetical protein